VKGGREIQRRAREGEEGAGGGEHESRDEGENAGKPERPGARP